MNKSKSDKITSKDIVKCCAIFFSILFIRIFLVDIMTVHGASMQPTLNEENDKLIVQKISSEYKHGDIVVLDSKENGYYVKRVIGLPNDLIEIHEGEVYVNGVKLIEPYIQGKTYSQNEKYKVSNNQLFVLGDNRENSKDSRIMGFINYNQIKGVGLYRYNIHTLQFNKLKR